MDRLTVRVKEGDRKDECFIPGNKNPIEKVEYVHEDGRWESEEYKGKAVDKLAEYEDLEEQGKLLKLPCKIGQRVYMIYQFCGEGAWEIEEHKIKLEDLENIGKTVFLTRQEAEQALAEMEGKK